MKVRNDQWLAGWRNRAAWVAGIFLVVLLPLGFTLVEGITRPRRIRDEDAVAQSSGSANPVSSLADVNRSVTNWGMGSRSVPAPVPEKPRGSDEFSVAGAVPLSDSQWIGADEPERQVQQRSVLSVIENLRGRDDVMSSEELVSTFLGSNGEAARTGGLAQVIRSEQDSQSDPASAGLRPETHTPSESEELPGAVANVVAVASAGPGEPQAGEASPVEKATPATHLQPVQRERVDVTIIRPRKQIVKQHDQVIGRCRATKEFAIVLIRPSHVGAYWWVMESLPRQADYFRAKVQFGNDETPDGSRFRTVVAFVPEDMEIPDAGTQFRELPAGLTFSQNLEYTLKRD